MGHVPPVVQNNGPCELSAIPHLSQVYEADVPISFASVWPDQSKPHEVWFVRNVECTMPSMYLVDNCQSLAPTTSTPATILEVCHQPDLAFNILFPDHREPIAAAQKIYFFLLLNIPKEYIYMLATPLYIC